MRLILTLLIASLSFAQTLGSVHFANSGNAQAQAPFLRGLALLHNFEYESAQTAFLQAEAADPDFAMAFWGEALTHVHPLWNYEDLTGARNILLKLGATPEARAAKAKTQRERDYLATVDTLFFSDADRDTRNQRYAEALANLHTRYPDDVDAASLYALSLLGTKALHRDYATYMKSAAVLEEYLPKYPDHPGVLHYMIHSYDDPVHAPLGLRAARRYGDIAGDAPHALHMTSHIFIAAGMWPEVIAANRKSFEVANRQAAAAGKPPVPCSHGSSWENYAYLQQGRFDESSKFLSFCAERIKDRAPDANAIEHLQMIRAQYILGTERWSDPAVNMPAPPPEFINATITYEYASAVAAAKRNDLAAAAQHQSALHSAHEQLKAKLAKETHPNMSYDRRADVLEQQVASVLLLANGKQTDAFAALTKARDLEASIPFEFGPPFVEKPSAELLAEAQLAAHQPKDAVDNLRDQLARTPGRTHTLRDLRTAAQSLNDRETEQWAAAQIEINTHPTDATVASMH